MPPKAPLRASLLVCAALAFAPAARAQNIASRSSDELTLEQAIALAIAHSPELEASSSAIRAAEANHQQARAWPNPNFSFDWENWGGSLPGASQSEMTFALQQFFELGGKRAARTSAAAEVQRAAQLDSSSARAAVIAEVKQRFYEVVAMEQLLGLAREDAAASEELSATVHAKVRAGAASPAEEARAAVDLASSTLDRTLLEKELDLARVRLAALWGKSTEPPSRLAGSLDSLSSVPSAQAVLDLAASHPEIVRTDFEIRAREAEIRAQRAQRIPDVGVEAGVRTFQETGEEGFVAGVLLPLPLWDRNRGGILEAEAALAREQAQGRRAWAAREREVLETYARLTAARAHVETLRANVIPGAIVASEQVHSAYHRGRLSYLDLLDARRTRLRAQREEILSRLEYARAHAALEKLCGSPNFAPRSE
ncbi:MAG TPA: TolC family protein [bacterium]|nr:TolC family protein [bacterium]